MAEIVTFDVPESAASAATADLVVTPLSGQLWYVRTPPEGSVIDFAEFPAAVSGGTTGVVHDLPTEYQAEVNAIRGLAHAVFGKGSAVEAKEGWTEGGQLELVVRVTFPAALADVAHWRDFQRAVFTAIPVERLAPISLLPEPK